MLQVNANDQLPKTACLHCIERLETHHELMKQFMFATRKLSSENKSASISSSSTSSTSIDATTTTSSSPPPC